MSDEIEKINIDDMVDSVDPVEAQAIVTEVAAKNALVVYTIQPPAELADRVAEIWRETVASVVPGHLTDKDIPVLTAYCRCVAEMEFCDQQLDTIINYSNFDPLDSNYYKAYDKWSERRLKAAAMALRMATAMRLTNQSFRTNTSVTNVTQSKNTWDDEDE